MIYLDEASTTNISQAVLDTMMTYFTDQWYNPSSLYEKAYKITKDVDLARKTIGNFINAKMSEIYFTSGGSESNCWAIQGFVNYCRRKGQTPSIITSVIEHKSIMECVDHMDADVHYIGVDSSSFIDIDALDKVLEYVSNTGNKILVSVQMANNEIGTIQSIQEIAELVHQYQAIFHTDAVQAFGHIPIDVEKMGIDMLSASGHKIHAPKGIGILYIKHGIHIDPIIYGSQMDGLRGGTENVPYIMGMAKAVEMIGSLERYDIYDPSVTFVRDYMIDSLQKKLNCKLNGSKLERLPNNINITFPQDITGEALIYLLDMSDIMVSAGSACNSHSDKPSHVLKAIGLSDIDATKTIRMTLPEDMDKHKADCVINEIEKQIRLLTTE